MEKIERYIIVRSRLVIIWCTVKLKHSKTSILYGSKACILIEEVVEESASHPPGVDHMTRGRLLRKAGYVMHPAFLCTCIQTT